MNTGDHPVAPPAAAFPAAAQGRRRKPVKTFLGIFGLLALAYIAYGVVVRQFVGLYYIPSETMEPTLMGHDAGSSTSGVTHADSVHDHILVSKLAYRLREPKFGDIVVFTAPKEADFEHAAEGAQAENVLVKRVIGLPGDTIEIKNGRVYRNAQPLTEPYIKEPMDADLEPNFLFGTREARGNARAAGWPIHLRARQFWVMGDNSNDSRYWGALERDRIIGKVTSIVATLSRQRDFP